MIIWLTGRSGAGKSALAVRLQASIGGVVLDGDAMRASISRDAGFSREDREEHNLRVARLARVLGEQGNVIVSVVAPMRDVREKIDAICRPFWVYVKRDLPEQEDHFYEPQLGAGYFTVDHDKLSLATSAIRVINALGVIKPPCSVFIGRFQPLHRGHVELIKSVLQEGKRVAVLLRDTEISEQNPYTIADRKAQFHEQFGMRVPVHVIPDVEEVCHGRRVGWGVREIVLDAATEDLSGTAMRRQLEPMLGARGIL